MKFSVEIDRKSLRVLCVFVGAVIAAWVGGREAVLDAVSLYLILKG